MPRFKIAHIREQGQDIIIIPLESSFGHKPKGEQQAAINDLQAHALGAGLKGTVVPVWDGGGGAMGFIAQNNWHPFFKSINLRWVAANLNRELSW